MKECAEVDKSLVTIINDMTDTTKKYHWVLDTEDKQIEQAEEEIDLDEV